MSQFQDFLMDDFAQVESIEKMVPMGGKERKMIFKPITAAVGDEIRKSSRKITFQKGQKVVETDQDQYVLKLIAETLVYPDLKNKELQDAWGVMGADNLLKAMKGRMLDGEYATLCGIVNEVNGYDKSMDDLVEEAKN